MAVGFPGGSVVKNSPASVGDTGQIPGLGRCPGGGNGNPLQYSCSENLMDQGTWRSTVHGTVESDRTQRLNNNIDNNNLQLPLSYCVVDVTNLMKVCPRSVSALCSGWGKSWQKYSFFCKHPHGTCSWAESHFSEDLTQTSVKQLTSFHHLQTVTLQPVNGHQPTMPFADGVGFSPLVGRRVLPESPESMWMQHNQAPGITWSLPQVFLSITINSITLESSKLLLKVPCAC